jgi:hypothetical protein
MILVFFQRRDDFPVVLFARSAFRWNDYRIQSALAGGLDPRRVRLIRDDDGDPRVGNAPGVDAIGDGNEIRAASGEKNAEGMHFSLQILDCRFLIAILR